MSIPIHTEEDFEGMRKAGRLAAEVLDFIVDKIKPGISTEEINTWCHNMIIENGAIPAPLNYKGFPKSVCTSVNEVICHGIPSETHILKDGDILNVDVTVILDGWHGDTSRMYYVGNPSKKAKNLCNVTYDALMQSIAEVKPGVDTSVICKKIEECVSDYGYSIVRDFCGHGLGKVFHAPPSIVHYYDPRNPVTVLEPGMFFTIEPMINLGTHAAKIMDDEWTAKTRDGKLSAQFEHSLGITENGVEIFTSSPKGYDKPPYNV